MRKIFLSAHPDDAVLSCGGLIFDDSAEGVQTEVWTFMCGAAKDIPKEHFTTRIEEDFLAVRSLGAKPVHYGYLDALYREKPDGSKLYGGVFSHLDPQDTGTIESISKLIYMNKEEGDKFMCPLAVGDHVDHVIVRRALELLHLPITYYTDFPYIEYVPEKLDQVVEGLAKYPVTVSPEGLKNWIEAACMYKSQNLYPTQEITIQKIKEYWAPINGIFLWKAIEE
jgi:hypothetical protein